jgi:hypothetical protein
LQTNSELRLTPYEATVLRQMAITAELTKTELTGPSQEEFLIAFEKSSAERIQRAFREWRDRSRFFPTIAELKGVLREIAIQEKAAAEAKAAADEKADAEAAFKDAQSTERREWLAKQVEELKSKLSMPQPPPRPRSHIVMPWKPLPVTPGMAMSADELRQRRDREREELQEATKAS